MVRSTSIAHTPYYNTMYFVTSYSSKNLFVAKKFVIHHSNKMKPNIAWDTV